MKIIDARKIALVAFGIAVAVHLIALVGMNDPGGLALVEMMLIVAAGTATGKYATERNSVNFLMMAAFLLSSALYLVVVFRYPGTDVQIRELARASTWKTVLVAGGVWALLVGSIAYAVKVGPGLLVQKAERRESFLRRMSSSESIGDIFRIAFQYDIDYSFVRKLSPVRRRVLIASSLLTIAAYLGVLIVMMSVKTTALGPLQPAGRVLLTTGLLWALFFGPYFVLIITFLEFTEKRNVQLELKAAHDMQMGLMPKEDPVVAGFDIAAVCVPANEVGGDFYDYVWLDRKKTKLGIAVADVSGKAMKAAMTAVLTSGMLYSELQKSASPRQVLRRINHPLYLRSDRRVFTALAFAVLDVRSRVISYSCAGQIPPVLIRNGRAEELKIHGLRLPLGIKDDLVYHELKIRLKKGDVLVFLTDGIVEAMNGAKEMYGFDGLRQSLLRSTGLSAAGLRDHLLEDVKQFAGPAPQHDDMTVVVVKVL